MRKINLQEVYTVSEASRVYNVSAETIKSRLRPSQVGEERIAAWVDAGIIRKSVNTWLITDDFMKLWKK